MARIRTIKPEFWTSEQVVECSPTARLLFVGMWNFCDDGGVHPASPRQLKMEVFPGDNLTIEQVNSLVDELLANKLIRQFSVDGRSFWFVTGWHHQKIEKKHIKYPQPNFNDDECKFDDQSTTSRRPVDDRSTQEQESKVEESKVKEKNIRGVAAPSAVADPSFGDDISNSPADPKPECHQTNEKAPPRRSQLPALPPTLSGDAMALAWREWIQHRSEIRKPLKPTTARKQIEQLEAMGPERALAALSHSMAQGWTGIYEPSQPIKPKPDDDMPF